MKQINYDCLVTPVRSVVQYVVGNVVVGFINFGNMAYRYFIFNNEKSTGYMISEHNDRCDINQILENIKTADDNLNTIQNNCQNPIFRITDLAANYTAITGLKSLLLHYDSEIKVIDGKSIINGMNFDVDKDSFYHNGYLTLLGFKGKSCDIDLLKSILTDQYLGNSISSFNKNFLSNVSKSNSNLNNDSAWDSIIEIFNNETDNQNDFWHYSGYILTFSLILASWLTGYLMSNCYRNYKNKQKLITSSDDNHLNEIELGIMKVDDETTKNLIGHVDNEHDMV